MNQEPQPTTIELNQLQASCISCRRIDSWHKLHTLLWLYEHRSLRLTCKELAERLYLGDIGMVKAMLGELRTAGFLAEEDGHCVLSDSPEILACLDYLHRAFADPLRRQELIDRIRQVGTPVEDR